ncbi:MAG: hypothetical protein WC371_03955 [Parachlamydiales bacterium]|jgi:predicted GH43/DUF377 family glycosyl hydrolase
MFHKLKKISAFLLFCFGFFGSLAFFYQLRLLKEEKKELKTKYQSFAANVFLKIPQLPFDLQNIPLAEESNLVIGIKEVQIRGVPAPYNASLIKSGPNYLIFFRYDVIVQNTVQPFFSYIGCAELDGNFEQTEKEFVRLDTQSNFSEDPRALWIGRELYVIYNDLHSSNPLCRSMHLANVDPQSLKVNFVTELDLQMQHIEKNWIPFEYPENSQYSLYFEYHLNPHTILKLPDPKTNSLAPLIFPNYSASIKSPWPLRWGEIQGGSTALQADGQYLGFFHSKFKDKDNFSWYLIGAYTFENRPPFRLSAISNYPIFFNGIYSSVPVHTANPLTRCLFPCGFVIENQKGRELVHLACGENDSHIKIITFDKKVLLKSLKKI